MSNKIAKGRATIRDVAKLAQVSPITVSRVVNNQGYVSPQTRQRVERAVAELHYIPNSLSQSLRYQKTDMITLLVSDVANPFWTTITRGVEDVCRHHGLSVILCNTDEDSLKLENYVRSLLQRQVDGFIISATTQDAAVVRMIEDSHIPVVLVDRVLEGVPSPAVYSDNEAGAYALTRHLIELGHEAIVMISGSLLQSTSVQRIRGYHQAMAQAGLSEQVIPTSYTQQSGYDTVMHLFRVAHPHPTALVAGNNFIAFGALTALEELGLRVPDDVSLVAFDDTQFQIFPKPFLTTAAQNPYHLGQEAAALLVQRLQALEDVPLQDVILPIELIVRRSTARPGAKNR